MSPWTHSDDSSNLSCSHVSSHTGDVTTPDDPASNTDLNTISKPFASHEAIEPSSELSLFSSYAKAAHQKLKENGFSKVDQGASNLPKKRATYMPRSKKSKQAELPQNRFIQDGQTWEIQFKTCQNNRYGKNPRCTQCISKVSGDSCRFMGIRVFLVDSTTDLPTTNAANIFLMSTLRPGDKLQFPARDSFNRAMDDASCLQLKTTIATSLLPILEQELKHAQLDQALRRDKETTCRQMCEFCATSIFSASWLCRQCGKEYCPECYQAIASTDARQIQGKERIRKLTACTSRRIHGVSELVPLTRFPIETLTEEIKVMHELTAAANLTKIEQDGPSPVMVFEAGAEPANSSENTWEGLSTIRAGLIADAKVGKLHLRSFHAPDLTSDGMHREWRKGEPLLVTGVLGKMENAWDPQAFIQRYGQDECCITRYDIDTSTQSVELTKLTTVGEFFSTFGTSREERERILGEGSWKLKDWPPMEEFSVTFPELYEDFNRAVPAPDYTRRDGVLNLGSCYPKGVMQPDLGPKMYNAWPSDEGTGGQGTTRLHMDMADAVNIMLYATPPVGEGIPEEHQAGVAAWDIFRAEDADKIRQFLREEKENNATNRDDPIHTQLYFIDAPMRIKLWSKYGVKGWRIYQKAGEAVFIPAGCAHQVCNLGDCIKVAVDFISPENVSRCFRLTSEFRELTHESKAWKQDVLSLRTTLWYAWCAYRQMEGAGPDVQLDKAEKSRSSVQAKMIRQQEGESAEMRPQHPKVTQLRRSAHKATSKKMITDDALDDEELKLPTRRKRNAPEDDLETPSNAAKRDKATPSKTKQKSISPR